MDPTLPSHAVLKDISATYNQHTIPREFLAAHTLPPEIWAQVVVAEGELDLKRSGETLRVTAGRPAVVQPNTPFSLQPTGKPVRFCLHYFHEPVLQDGRSLAAQLGRKRAA